MVLFSKSLFTGVCEYCVGSPASQMVSSLKMTGNSPNESSSLLGDVIVSSKLFMEPVELLAELDSLLVRYLDDSGVVEQSLHP